MAAAEPALALLRSRAGAGVARANQVKGMAAFPAAPAQKRAPGRRAGRRFVVCGRVASCAERSALRRGVQSIKSTVSTLRKGRARSRPCGRRPRCLQRVRAQSAGEGAGGRGAHPTNGAAAAATVRNNSRGGDCRDQALASQGLALGAGLVQASRSARLLRRRRLKFASVHHGRCNSHGEPPARFQYWEGSRPGLGGGGRGDSTSVARAGAPAHPAARLEQYDPQRHAPAQL